MTRQTTAENIANFKRQINALLTFYDWDREVNTTDPTTTNGRNGFSPLP